MTKIYFSMLRKATVLKTIQELPEEFSLDELIERFLFINELEKRIQESKDGKVTDHEEVKRQILGENNKDV